MLPKRAGHSYTGILLPHAGLILQPLACFKGVDPCDEGSTSLQGSQPLVFNPFSLLSFLCFVFAYYIYNYMYCIYILYPCC